MKKVLITGATGFLGSHLAPLLEHKYECSAIVRNASGCPPHMRPIVADLTSAHAMEMIREQVSGSEILIHLAAEVPKAGTTLEEERGIQAQQSVAMQNFLNILPESIRHIVYSSTLDVFGLPQYLPIDEKHPTAPMTPYGHAKLQGEKLLTEFADARGIRLAILRMTQIYGPGEPPIKAIPLFIEKVSSGQSPVIFGDGSDLRDYIEVTDAARAVLASVEKQADGLCIIASGTSVTLKSVAEEIVRLSGKKLDIHMKDRRKEKIDFRFDVSKAKELLDFEAKISLSEGLKMQYDHYRSSTSA